PRPAHRAHGPRPRRTPRGSAGAAGGLQPATTPGLPRRVTDEKDASPVTPWPLDSVAAGLPRAAAGRAPWDGRWGRNRTRPPALTALRRSAYDAVIITLLPPPSGAGRKPIRRHSRHPGSRRPADLSKLVSFYISMR